MIKTLLGGTWICVATAAAIYAGAAWKAQQRDGGSADQPLEGLEHRKTKPMNVQIGRAHV